MTSFHSEIMAAAADGALVLTVNKRLCRHLRRLYDAEMAGRGRPSWMAPRIDTLEQWLRSVLAGMGEECRLLGRFAVQRLWETVIEESTSGTPLGLLQVPAAARLAMEAHRQLHDYRVAPPTEDLTEDQTIFLRWRESFLEACRKGDWLDPAGLISRVAEEVASGKVEVPSRVLLAGFDEFTPAQEDLRRVLSARGVEVGEVPPPVAPVGRVVRTGCADPIQEIRHAARWARRLLDRGEERIGIVVPRLGESRSLIERIFREEIDPASLLAFGAEEEAFGLSLGLRLADQGPIVAALEVLGLEEEIPLETASRLLRSPYLGGSLDEACARALLETRMRGGCGERVRLERLAALARRDEPQRAPRFARICDLIASRVNDRRKRSPGEWAERFTELLLEAGWPGQRPPDSGEYQALDAWRETLLPALVGLDPVSPPLSRMAAAGLMRRLAGEIEFQPETPESPIQVVGHLEAAGLSFDHLWVLGLSEEVFPAPAAPNPFLPNRLQNACGMPHADGEREMAFARKVAARLFAGAPHVVVSHPRRRGDCELRPSPLIRPFPEEDVELAPSSAPSALLAQGAPALSRMVDDTGPGLCGQEAVGGGTAILRDQALCPFRAFVYHRLDARALETPDIGIDPRTRGSLLHAVLETFWQQVWSLEHMLELDDAALRSQVERCVSSALEGAARGGGLAGEVLDIERDRMTAVILEWLAVEKERPPFSVVETEKEHVERFGGLTIRTKVDRIDRTAGGEETVIDYKTGRIDFEDLLGERLLEPQLPIYGIGRRNPEIGGVGFGIVRRGECALKGVCREASILPGIEAFAGSRLAHKHGVGEWEELLDRWRRQLDTLGEEFVRGHAAVDPVDPVKACRYCDLPPLCRIEEIGLQEEQ